MALKEYKDFMCICKPDARERAATVLGSTIVELGTDNVVSAVVFGLASGLPDGYDGYIDSIQADQWAAVRAVVQKVPKGLQPPVPFASLYVQCDIVEHGFARVWQLAKQACEEHAAS